MSRPVPDPDSPFASFAQPKKGEREPAPHTPDPDSPFASFAQPKPSALKQFVERQQETSRGQKVYWQYLSMALAGTILGAAVAVAIGVGPEHIVLGIVWGAVGALAGVPAGWVLAAVSWAVMRARLARGGLVGLGGSLSPLEAETVRGNQWDRLMMWLTIWAALGMVLGAGIATAYATNPVNHAETERALGWTMCGACLGLVLASGVWLILLRRANLAAAKRKAEAMD
jgi:hypothetical protein